MIGSMGPFLMISTLLSALQIGPSSNTVSIPPAPSAQSPRVPSVEPIRPSQPTTTKPRKSRLHQVETQELQQPTPTAASILLPTVLETLKKTTEPVEDTGTGLGLIVTNELRGMPDGLGCGSVRRFWILCTWRRWRLRRGL